MNTPNTPTETSKFAFPELNEGETYAGAIIQPDGTGLSAMRWNRRQ